MEFKQAERMEKVEPSATREVFSKCVALMQQNIPYTALTLGEPDFPTPAYIVDACKEALDAGKTRYVAENGIPELRAAICEKLARENNLHYTPDEISVTTGVAMAMFIAIVATLNPGDEILVPNPVYVTYWQIPRIAQAKIVPYDLLEENNYQADIQQLRSKITDKTKMLVVVSPSNPTGGVMRHETLTAMAELAKEHDLLVLSDEIYDHFVYDDTLKLESIASLPGMKERCIVATGPLTSDALADKIASLCGGEGLHFYDAVAPIVTLESVDMESAFFASRYDKGTADYVNCPMDEAEYKAFVRELCAAKEASVHGFDDGGVFEGCMPVEVMARRGEDTLRYGPMKPVGLRDPRTGRENYAVVQLRRDNADGTLYNIVGFQTHLTWGEQKRVFSMIPALKNAEFVRYGVMHRNTYLNSPKLLDRYYRFRAEPRLSFAGQMTGVEGYVESAASGMLVGIETASRMLGFEPVDFPQETAIGALSLYISGGSVGDFQPMNVNFGIISPLGYRVKGKRNKNAEISARSLAIIEELMKKEVFGCENNS